MLGPQLKSTKQLRICKGLFGVYNTMILVKAYLTFSKSPICRRHQEAQCGASSKQIENPSKILDSKHGIGAVLKAVSIRCGSGATP